MNILKTILKSLYLLLPTKLKFLFAWVRHYSCIWEILFYRKDINSKEIALKKKNQIKIVFFAENLAIWKYDRLIRLLQKHSCFRPIVVLAPQMLHFIHATEKERFSIIAEMQTVLEEKGYEVFNGYKGNNTWFNVGQIFNPEIIFYSLPYDPPKERRYRFSDFPNALFCYAPYGVLITNTIWTWDLPFHNCAWKLFYLSDYELTYAAYNTIIKGKNIVVAGSPMADDLLDRDKTVVNPWKEMPQKRKKVIWAPHHSIFPNTRGRVFGELTFSSFLDNYQLMMDLAKKFESEIQIAFKPHPALLHKLYKHEEWGKERADAYYLSWDKLPNGQLISGDYIDLFLTSDALIHDSASFVIEYLFTIKPVMFFAKNKPIDQMIDFAAQAFAVHYYGHNIASVEDFIKKVVVNSQDPMYQLRKDFFEKFLIPPNGKTASENICDELLKYVSFGN